jgi:hypothetical protein
MLGKRKRRSQLGNTSAASASPEANHERFQALFRAHFESQYEPLPAVPPPLQTTNNEAQPAPSSDYDEASSWNGISDLDTSQAVTISHTAPAPVLDPEPKEQRNMFMVRFPSPSPLLHFPPTNPSQRGPNHPPPSQPSPTTQPSKTSKNQPPHPPPPPPKQPS